jgi:hypothetical protein
MVQGNSTIAPPPASNTVVQAKPQIINTMKRVKEEIIRYDSPAHAYAAGEQQEMELFQGSGMTYYTVRIGEGIELLALGTKSKYTKVSAGDAAHFFDRLTVQDFNGSEWNKFYIVPTERTQQASNELPFTRLVNFERLMMSWGYKSFLSTNKDIAPTLKMSEGDKLRLFLRNNAGATFDISGVAAPRVPTVAVVRRFLPGSDIDYKHFDQYDGGIKSTKRYYTDYQPLTTTTAGTDTEAWNLTIIRNEAYKFFQAGVLASDPTTAARLIQGKIMIDDPLTEYNKYYLNPTYNNLPFCDTHSLYQDPTAGAAYINQIEQTHRFAPTIDVLKNRNKDLKLYVRDNGNAAANIVSRFYGIRYIL